MITTQSELDNNCPDCGGAGTISHFYKQESKQRVSSDVRSCTMCCPDDDMHLESVDDDAVEIDVGEAYQLKEQGWGGEI